MELRLHRLAKLQILLIQNELKEKESRARALRKLLKSESERWKLVRKELVALKGSYGQKRRTIIAGAVEEASFDEEAFIVDEDAMVVLSKEGRVKRQQRVKDVSKARTREGDEILEIIAGSTRSAVAFFSNLGTCYVTRIADVPATTGYGHPVQSLFKLKDGERIVSMIGFDPRFLEVPEVSAGAEDPEEPFALAVTKQGMSLRFSLRGHRDPSTRAGRKYARLG